ncbi:hypothetical protein MSAN_00511700 [Mycena sanguinolenta]|uniref:Transmembrane protein n=1 Tax=Mycena sanguinolenta TaxID=230812 RepID=A0A8H6Z921_9AGAR|nr:hypothetical protein MSAN_00511700 [Mycena sanguinolenta]
MIRFTVLFNPVVRVWNTRILLLASIFNILVFLDGGVPSGNFNPTAAITLTFCLIIVHHIIFVIPWSLKGLAVVDLGLVLLELASEYSKHPIIFVMIKVQTVDPAQFAGRIVDILFVPPFLALVLSAVFRIATILKCKDRILLQRAAFLGSCRRTRPPYTPLRILLNRSIARPLVRGESKFIIFPRAVILSSIAVGVPAFALYSIVVAPENAQVFTKSIRGSSIFDGNVLAPGSPTIFLSPLNVLEPSNITMFAPEVYTSTSTQQAELIHCPIGPGGTFIECPCSWPDILNISISVVIPDGTPGVDVTLVQGFVQDPSWFSMAEWSELVFHVGATGVPLFLGSHLAGVFTWTRRDLIIDAFPTPSLMSLFTTDVTGLQTNPAVGLAGSTGATLTLFQQRTFAKRLLQDNVDVTPLSGIATFGGFWTFLNGAFALFFGANILYFMFGRRPLSALGLVHIFQRRNLVRRWHQDFPTIHTEGGLPGSKSAGIVAFIRERLVDLGEDPRESEDESAVKDPNETETDSADEHDDNSSFPRYVLDEIPLMEIDLGMEVSGQKRRP